MTTVTLKPQAKTMYTVQPERSHPKLSLRRVLYVKFLRWIDKASLHTLARTTCRGMACCAVFTAAIAPSYLLGFIGALTGSKWLLGICAVIVFLYHKTILKQVRRAMNRKGNQHCFHGVPVPELADYLLSNKKFPVEDAMHKLHITQPQQRRIASLLEKHKVLIRGESNARVLQPISRHDLVKQLTGNFPLEWSEHEQEWVNRRDTFSLYALDRERKERKEEERVEKRTRKLHRIEHKIAELQNPFTVRELEYPLQSR